MPLIGLGQLRVFPDINIKSLYGEKVSIKEIDNNNNPIVVIFWATWEKLGKTQLNTISTIYNDWQNKTGVKIVIVSIDDNRSASAVPRYVKAVGWPFDAYMDTDHILKNSLGISTIPHTVLLNGKKEIVKVIRGYESGDEYALYNDIVSISNKEPTENNKEPTENNTEWAGNGSGFFISTSGYIVTNNHVIDGVSEIEVEFKYKNEIRGFNAKVIKTDKTNDLAIIKIDDSEFSNLSDIPYNFKTRSVDIGTEIFALGYPMALSLMGKDIKFTDGKISSKTGLGGDITTYQIQVPIQPGNSGGPLFDFEGNLIGITSSGVNRKLDITENVNYAIKSSYLLNLIDVLPETITLPSSTQLSSKKLTEQIKILSDYVVLIKVK